MRLTVLGINGPYPGADGACSLYLLEADGQRLLLDAGSGALARLQRHVPLTALDAVLLSHLHFDHIGDMLVLRYALNAAAAGQADAKKLPVYAPASPAEMRALVSGGLFDDRDIDDGVQTAFGALSVSFTRVAHPMPSYAMRFCLGDAVFCYSGDTTPCDGLLRAARSADVLLCDAAFLHDALTPTSPHCSARQAAEAAAEAGVKRLILTHVAPNAPLSALLAEARDVFPQAEMAAPGAVYDIA